MFIKPLKIIVINHEFPPFGGGGSYQTKYLVEELANQGHIIYLLTIANPTEPPVLKINNYIKVNIPAKRKSNEEINFFAAFLFIFRTAFFLEEFLESNEIDIIHAQFSLISGFAVALINNVIKRKKIKFIITSLGADIYEPTRFKGFRFFFNFLNKWIFKKADCITAPSKEMCERIKKITKNPEIYKINLGIDITLFKQIEKDIARKELGINKDEFVLITVCRLVKRKNLKETIFIFNEVQQKINNIKLFIVGEGKEKKKVESYIKKFNLEEKIKLTGKVNIDLLQKYYSAADLFYTNSLHESFGLVYLEAMNCGCPVLAPYNGGAEEIITNDFNGYLLKFREEFLNKIIELKNNFEKLKKLSNNSIEHAKKFDYKNFVDKYLAIYNK
ncbi:MAG TPA: glycosyltransferase family 4 protein [bacterium]|nr:glycosyltransferase family 4 protein [bacterium]HOL47945.1 glycosyltransferase family 4 protein [bacterium]HPQ19030.1 glycosyltransferase family 4 protein [bacterium]